jgi:large subunit ribosomal protein L21
MYALVQIQGKQYKAEAGSRLRVDRLAHAQGEEVRFEHVLLTSEDGKITVGRPFVPGVAVKAVVEGHEVGKKVLVVKFKRRKHYRRRRGHRQQYTVIRVEAIEGARAG